MTNYTVPIIYPRIVDSRDFDQVSDGQGPAAIVMVNPQTLIPTSIAIGVDSSTTTMPAFRLLTGMTNAGELTIKLRATSNAASGVLNNSIPLLDNASVT